MGPIGSGVAMGTKTGPSYVNMLLEQYTGPIPDFFRKFIDDCFGRASCSRADLERFISLVENFHPALTLTWEISETCVSFLDILVS